MNWLGWSLQQWSTVGDVAGGIGAIATSVVAGIAAIFAFHQVREARELREEQAQPYVVAYFAISKASSMYIEFVVKNIGQTLAKDVQIALDPPLQSTLDDRKYAAKDAYILQEGVPTLPPELEYRLLFESGPELYKQTDLPRRYRATITYRTSRGRHITLEYFLDLETFFGYESLAIYGEHDSAKALRDIAGSIKTWTHHGGILVHARDDYKRQQKLLEQAKARRVELENQEDDKLAPGDTGPNKVETLDSSFQSDI